MKTTIRVFVIAFAALMSACSGSCACVNSSTASASHSFGNIEVHSVSCVITDAMVKANPIPECTTRAGADGPDACACALGHFFHDIGPGDIHVEAIVPITYAPKDCNDLGEGHAMTDCGTQEITVIYRTQVRREPSHP